MITTLLAIYGGASAVGQLAWGAKVLHEVLQRNRQVKEVKAIERENAKEQELEALRQEISRLREQIDGLDAPRN